MCVDVDLSQYCDVILLWNAVAMFVISFFTDYWEYRTYDFLNLLPALLSFNDTLVIDYEQITSSAVVEFPWVPCDPDFESTANVAAAVLNSAGIQKPNSIYRLYLFNEYGNLFKECNELQDVLRIQLRSDRTVYILPCHYYVFSQKPWSQVHLQQDIHVMEALTLLLGSASAILSLVALFNGTLGAVRNKPKLMASAGMCLGVQGTLYLCTVTIFAAKLPILKQYYNAAEVGRISCQERLINAHRHHTLGWSYGAALFSLLLNAISTYVFIANSKVIRRRRARIKRRQRMEAALMSSCKQEVALAVRAKMIVITPEPDGGSET